MVEEGRGTVTAAGHLEGLRAANLLAALMHDAGYSERSVEEALGWGRKTLQVLFSGKQPIRFSHVASVCEVCGLDLGEFYVKLSEGEQRKKPGKGAKKKIPSRRPERQPMESPSYEELYRQFRRWLKEQGIGGEREGSSDA